MKKKIIAFISEIEMNYTLKAENDPKDKENYQFSSQIFELITLTK